ncbi:MAG: hypothetical protein AB1478_11795 [Nitrospirota bacterium]
MPYKGIVKDNIVILQEAAKLSDGMRVIVTPEEEEKEPNFNADPFCTLMSGLLSPRRCPKRFSSSA